MIIFPAIDLAGGQVVRLRQGDPANQTIFDADPAAVAQRWAAQGAAWLHVVDLDRALSRGTEASTGVGRWGVRLAEIRAAVALPIQFGGGIRRLDDAARALDLGATRVVLGTVAVREPEIVAAAIHRFGAEKVVVGIDARDGRVATHGWQETSVLDAVTLACRMRDMGVLRAVYTDIARDGMLSGVNAIATAGLARRSGLRVIASGGVARLDDIRTLAAYAVDGVEGVIVGQALYTGALDLHEAILAGE